MSWKEAWNENRTPWDAGGSPPILEKLVEAGELPEGRALVPGCGSGYDVLTLAGPNRVAVGLDMAPGARQRFESLRDEAGVEASQAVFEVADFFEYDPDEPFDLIVDYTFLCAIEPERREAWVGRIDELLAEDGELLTIIFPVVDKPPEEGPPYALSPDTVTEWLDGRFESFVLEPIEESREGREGKEWLGRWRRVRGEQ